MTTDKQRLLQIIQPQLVRFHIYKKHLKLKTSAVVLIHFLSNVWIYALGQHGFVHPSLWFMSQSRLPINNLHVYCTSPWWLQAGMGLWTGGWPAAPNQRCMQAAAAAVVTLKSYAADLLWPSAEAKRCVSQTDLTDNTSWESGECPTWIGQHFLQHLI